MHFVTFDFKNFHKFGSTFYDYLGLRKKYFVDELNWDIFHDDHVEMDQYDNPLAHYSVVIKDGQVVGGTRMAPTSAKWGDATYMLKDVADGKIPKIPSQIYVDNFETDLVWECTRLVVSSELKSMRERISCLSLIFDGVVKESAPLGAKQLIGLSQQTFPRLFRSFGYDCKQISDPYTCPEDGKKYAVLMMPAAKGFVDIKEAA
jgi:N-acyl-L-homoserine lactone synthetase